MSVLAIAIATVIFALLAAFGSLSIVDPELAFRLENIFQLRSVELSTFGVLVHQLGGLVAVLASLVLSLSLGGPLEAAVVLLAALAVPAYYRRTYGRVLRV